jgi:hypothetical protein
MAAGEATDSVATRRIATNESTGECKIPPPMLRHEYCGTTGLYGSQTHNEVWLTVRAIIGFSKSDYQRFSANPTSLAAGNV